VFAKVIFAPVICNKITHYMRPWLFADFLIAFSLIRGPKTAFFEEPIPQFQPYMDLFIRGTIIEERLYHE
jgi:hypothetical protein